MRIKRGDMVEVTNGADARRIPRRVLQIVQGGRKILIEGVNRVYKHVRRGHPKSPQGGRLSREMPIDISNVQFFCDTCGRGVRLGAKFLADGSKVRYCKKCGKEVGVISPPKASRATTPAG